MTELYKAITEWFSKDFNRSKGFTAIMIVLIVTLKDFYPPLAQSIVMSQERRDEQKALDAAQERKYRDIAILDSLKASCPPFDYVQAVETHEKLEQAMLNVMLAVQAEAVYLAQVDEVNSDTVSLNPLNMFKVTIVMEEKVPTLTSIKEDWQDKAAPPGVRYFLDSVQRVGIDNNDALLIEDTSKDFFLSKPRTKAYIEAYGTASIISCYVGKTPGKNKYLFMSACYFSRSVTETPLYHRQRYLLTLGNAAHQVKENLGLI